MLCFRKTFKNIKSNNIKVSLVVTYDELSVDLSKHFTVDCNISHTKTTCYHNLL